MFRLGTYPITLSIIALAIFAGALCAVLRGYSLSYLVLMVLLVLACIGVCSRRAWLCCIGWCLLGYLWAYVYGEWTVNRWMPRSLEGQETVITGHLIDFPRRTDDGWQFDFYAEELQGKVRLSMRVLPDKTAPSFSCYYRLRAKLKRPRGFLNAEQYDYQAWLLQEAYVATGYVRTVEHCAAYQPSIFLRWRQNIAAWIQSVPISEQAASTLSALLIGNYADIDMMQWQTLRDSGTIHLLSVSGLHIVLVAVLFHAIFRYGVCLLVAPLRVWPAEHWASVAALLFAVLYALLTGFSVATQRSLIMIVVAIVQRMLYGRFQLSLIFLLSLVLVVLSNPLAMLSASFWFTYVATAVLMLSNINVHKKSLSFWQTKVYEPLRLQMIIFVVMLPILLFVYGRVSWLSLPLNILAVPWVSFISLPSSFLALGMKPLFPVLAERVLQFSARSLDVYWQVMQWVLESVAIQSLELGGIDTVALLLAVVGVSVLCFLPSVMPLRYFSLLLCMPLLLPKSMVLPTGVADIRVLDVGQGLSVVVRTQHAVLVYDVGDKYSERFDAGRDIVATTLRNFRRKTIDMLMISHADSDHAGGRHGLLQEVSAKQLWSGTPEQLEKNVDGSDVYFPCDAGMHWRWDDVDFRVLSPDVSRTNHSENDQSCVVMIEVGSHRVLLTADIEKNTEQSLVDTHADLRADVLLSPHHGSKTSSSPQFLTAVGAKTVVISAGYLNRFHHPAKAVVERYTARDMRMFNTAEQGAVRMQLSKAGVTVDSALCSKPVFWHRDRYNAHCLSDATEPDFAR